MVHGLRFLRARGLIRKPAEIVMEDHRTLLMNPGRAQTPVSVLMFLSAK